mmetsp:Transcript_47196/g.112442  ORF Transcript_47196/g.112442 Transcript_47196/m.112442 type:complete len:217 (+) Transcript_47196:667-1317(+)
MTQWVGRCSIVKGTPTDRYRATMAVRRHSAATAWRAAEWAAVSALAAAPAGRLKEWMNRGSGIPWISAPSEWRSSWNSARASMTRARRTSASSATNSASSDPSADVRGSSTCVTIVSFFSRSSRHASATFTSSADTRVSSSTTRRCSRRTSRSAVLHLAPRALVRSAASLCSSGFSRRTGARRCSFSVRRARASPARCCRNATSLVRDPTRFERHA